VQIPDSRARKPTGHGNGWTEVRLRSFRRHHETAVYCENERAARGRLEAAAPRHHIDDGVDDPTRRYQGIVEEDFGSCPKLLKT
jgi:hypothetical protein